jgi:hypothetical protein
LLDLLQPLPRGMRVGGERYGDQDDRNHKNQNDGQNKQARQKLPLVAVSRSLHIDNFRKTGTSTLDANP